MSDALTLATLAADHFRPLVGQALSLELSAGAAVSVTLTELDEQPARRRPGDARAPFWLVLQAPPGSPARQGTYALSHPDLGRWELFMTPLSGGPEGPTYQVVFG